MIFNTTFNTIQGKVVREIELPSQLYIKKDIATNEYIEVSESKYGFADDPKDMFLYETVLVTKDNLDVMAWFYDRDILSRAEEYNADESLVIGFSLSYHEAEKQYSIEARGTNNNSNINTAVAAIEALTEVDTAVKEALIIALNGIKG